MRIATWNVNSIRLRAEQAVTWLKETQPDVVCLQEIKCQNEQFPREPFEALGYNVTVHGQKGFNGVALLSKLPLEDVTHGLAGDESDVQARFIEAVVSVKGGVARVCCMYLPNGNPPQTEKYDYKMGFMARLKAFAAERLKLEEPFVIAGDYNVIPGPADASDPSAWTQDALYLPRTRATFRDLLAMGFTDAIRATSDSDRLFSFWDYQAGAWQRDFGIRIDHLLLSPQAADRLIGAGIDKHVRAWERPSDHVPVWVDLKLAA
ncbi:exodeoxyribonuclease III [Azorhizobium oxalatiphilum]|uniref:Exodeoxyribonuclease III n=1 Tax=Azorhizobium oxalatiphilum TaxID=980631 RepID=A0A917BSG2_9HYPH|nr:exodeoxyribonuclease III [Azorhizobium oxalatiphilum]GGF55717.1 exodeoxyribonuclease III [Azorhizobium oxalatiphilum]